MAFTKKEKEWIEWLSLIYARCEASLTVKDDLEFLVKIKSKYPYMFPVNVTFTARNFYKNNGDIFELSDDEDFVEWYIRRALGINSINKKFIEDKQEQIQKAVNDAKRILKNLNALTLEYLKEHPFENTFWIPSLLSSEVERAWNMYEELLLLRYRDDAENLIQKVEEIFIKKHMAEEFINAMDNIPRSRKTRFYKNSLVIYERLCDPEDTSSTLLDLLYNWFDKMVAPSYSILDNGDFVWDFAEDIKDGII